MSRSKQVILRPNKRALPRKDERDEARIALARNFLWQLMRAAKEQAGPMVWIREGGLDAEEFVECLETGRWHPRLKRWQGLTATDAAHRKASTHRELAARRFVVLSVIALERLESFKTRDEMYEEVAKAAASVFEKPPTGETVHHWCRELTPPLGPDDEKVLAGGISRAAYDGQQLLGFVVPHGHEFQALTADGALVGSYADQAAARDALLDFEHELDIWDYDRRMQEGQL